VYRYLAGVIIIVRVCAGILQEECDYPFLFNELTLACDDFAVVQCGPRYEPKAPCTFSTNTHAFTFQRALMSLDVSKCHYGVI